MSCINRNLGHSEVEPSFAAITGRPKWAIPWMENDPDLVAPEPWAGRMRYDAADAKRLGCTGLLGIHWRTKIMSPNVAALADAAWDQSWAPSDFAAIRQKTQELRTGAVGGSVSHFTEPVQGTDEAAVYQSVRYNLDSYTLAVPNGKYSVTLKFNEPFYSEAGKRVFSVDIQGRRVIDDLDIFAKAGKNRALDFNFPDIAVTDGTVNIGFVKKIKYPCIAGIIVDGRSDAGRPFRRAINCGGERYKDYGADAQQPVSKMDRRGMPVQAFYIDYARANFGADAADTIGKIFTKIDGRGLPEPVGWLRRPGDYAGKPGAVG